MDKRIILAGLLVALVVVSGCIKVEIRETVNATGISDMAIKMDMSNFPTQEGQEEINPCDDMTAEDAEVPLTNVQCSYEDKIVTVTGQYDRSGQQALTIDGTEYSFDIKNAIEEMGEGDSAQELPEDPAQIQQLKAMGLSYDYYVKLPGTVVEQKGGELQSDGSVKFDILELPSEAYVKSSTTATGIGIPGFDTTTILIGIAVVIVVGVAAVIFLKRG